MNLIDDTQQNSPAISVIMPLYNVADYIEEALHSVLRQTLPMSEIILVDDGSNDNTAAVCKSFGRQVTYIHQQNQGAACARNTGIRAANYDWYCFLDGDDVWPDDRTSILYAATSTAPATELVFGAIANFEDVGHQRQFRQPRAGRMVTSALIHRRAFDSIGEFDSSTYAGDVFEWGSRVDRTMTSYKIIDNVVTHRRIHSRNSGRLRREGQRDEYFSAIRRHLDARQSGKYST